MNAHRRAQPFVHQPPPSQRLIGSMPQAQGQHASSALQVNTDTRTQSGSTLASNQNQGIPMRQAPQQQQPPHSPPIPTHDPTRKRPQFLADELLQSNAAANTEHEFHHSDHSQQQQQPQTYLFRPDPPASSFASAPPAARTNPTSYLNPPLPNPKPPQHQQPQDPSKWSLSDLLANILRDKDTVTIIDFLSTVIDHERLYDVTLVEDSFMNMLFQWTEENECSDLPMSQEDLLLLLDQLKEVNEINGGGQDADNAQDQQQQQEDGMFVDQRFFTIMSPGTPSAKQFAAMTPAKQRMFMQIVTPLSMKKRGIRPPNRQPMFGGGGGGQNMPATSFESRIPRPTAFPAPARPISQATQQKQDQQQQPWNMDLMSKNTNNPSNDHQRAPSDIAITDHHPPLNDDFWLSDQISPAFPPPQAKDQGQQQKLLQRPPPADQPDAPLRYHDLFGSDIPAPAEMDQQHAQQQPTKFGPFANNDPNADVGTTTTTHLFGNANQTANLTAPPSALPTRDEFLARGTAAERDVLLEYETQIQTLTQLVSTLKSHIQLYKKELAESAEHEVQIMNAIDEYHAHARKLKRKCEWYHDEVKKLKGEVEEAVKREEALLGKVDELEREAREARDREAGIQDEYRQVVEEWRGVLAERDELQVMLHEARKEVPAGGASGELGGLTGAGGQGGGAGSLSLGAELISGTGAALMSNLDPDTALRIGRLEAENEHLRRQLQAAGGSTHGGRSLISKVHAEIQAGTSAFESGLPSTRDAEVMVRPDRYPCGTQYMDPERVEQLAELGIIDDEPDTMVSGLHDYDAGDGEGGATDFVDNDMGLSVVPEGEEMDEQRQEQDEDESAVLPDPLSPTPIRVAGPGDSLGGRGSLLGKNRPTTHQQPPPGVGLSSPVKPSPHKTNRPSLMSQAGLDKALSLRDRIKLLATDSRNMLGKPGLLLMGLSVLAVFGVFVAFVVQLFLLPSELGPAFGDFGPDLGDDLGGVHGPLIESSPVLDPGYYCLIGIRQRVEDVVDAAGGSEF